MPSIAELPDDPKYTIKAVSSQTGIRPVTLRAWERRHDLLSPHRSDNRYRLYSERDVAILRWIKQRLDNGISISSAVAELRQLARNGAWPEAIPNSPIASEPRQPAQPAEFYARQLYQALIRHAEARAEEILSEVQQNFSLLDICQNIFTPALVEIGEAWYRGDVSVTTEHFASAYLRGKLLALFQAYPTRRGAGYILIGAAPTEQHEIGSLMMAVLLRSQGYRVEYLGPDIPLEDLADYASYEHPNMVILSASSEESQRALLPLPKLFSRQRPVPLFGYAGRAFDAKPETRNISGGYYLGANFEQGLKTVQTLLSKPAR